MSSKLMPTTHECVHLFMRGHLWSRDKDGGHTICKLHGSMFYKTGIIADESFTFRE